MISAIAKCQLSGSAVKTPKKEVGSSEPARNLCGLFLVIVFVLHFSQFVEANLLSLRIRKIVPLVALFAIAIAKKQPYRAQGSLSNAGPNVIVHVSI